MQSNTVGSVRMPGMTSHQARHADSIRWLPAERLGQFNIDARLRPWLIGKGLLTQTFTVARGGSGRIIPGGRIVLRRAGLGIRADRGSGYDALRASVAR